MLDSPPRYRRVGLGQTARKKSRQKEASSQECIKGSCCRKDEEEVSIPERAKSIDGTEKTQASPVKMALAREPVSLKAISASKIDVTPSAMLLK